MPLPPLPLSPAREAFIPPAEPHPDALPSARPSLSAEQLQEKKRELASAALSGTKLNIGKGGNRLGVDELMMLFKVRRPPPPALARAGGVVVPPRSPSPFWPRLTPVRTRDRLQGIVSADHDSDDD